MAEKREEYETGDSEAETLPWETGEETENEIGEVIEFLGAADTSEIRYVLDRWDMKNDRIVVEGHIEEISVTWTMARGEYQADKTTGTLKLIPDNLKCDIVVEKATAEIVESGGDIGIVGQVVKRLSRELDLRVQGLMAEHFEAVYAVPKKARGGEKKTKRTVL